jgi:hypothetical protein
MAISKTDILNKALTLIGAAPIINIDDQTTNARNLSRVYETALRSLLSETKWNFATTRALLSVVTDTPAWNDIGETYVYQKPANLIRIFGVSANNVAWREEGDLIYSDTQGLGIRYTYYIDDPSKYPAAFVDAFVDRLAADIAYSIVNSSTLAEKFYKMYESVSLPRAQSANAQTGIQQVAVDDAWEMAKYSDNPINV